MYLTKFCILCLVPNQNLTSILLQDEDGIVIENKLEVILLELVNFRPDISKFVCRNCLEYLNSIYKFRLRCLKNIPTLNEYLQKSEIPKSYTNLLETKTEIKCEIESNIETNVGACNSEITCDILTNNQSYLFNDIERNSESKCQQLSSNEQLPETYLKDNINIKQEYEIGFENLKTPYEIFSEINEEKYIPDDNDATNINDTNLIDPKNIEEKRSQNTNIKKKYKCKECHTKFLCLSDLERHRRSVHIAERPYKCTTCNKTFKRHDHLKRHSYTHTDEKQHACDVCDKTFSQKSSLKEHKRIHTNARPYECSVCKKTFTQSGNLTIHMRSHTGEKPYHCHLCQHTSASSNDLKFHIRTHTLDKPHECDVCHKTFIQPNKLIRHKRIHSKGKGLL